MSRNRWPLIAVAVLFLGPFVAAVVLFVAREHFSGFPRLPNPDRELIANPPVVPLVPLYRPDGSATDPAWSRSRWSLIYARMTGCEVRCAEALTRLHQVYLALGADRNRVQQVFLAPENETEAAAATDFLTGALDSPDGAGLILILGAERLEDGRIFVVDPRGYVILSYPADADQKRLLDDLERLLRASWVG
jgi:cytochrome oxidase Cu insertion factor (SCO1/SenC/PrrC family)